MTEELPPEVRRVAALLAQGLDDRGVSRREYVTVRTVRRRVARLLRFLGAATRFQAGYLLGRVEIVPPVERGGTAPPGAAPQLEPPGPPGHPPSHEASSR